MIFKFPSATIYNVVDGDTFDAIVDTGFNNSHKDRFRLLGVNAPEQRGVTRQEGLRVSSIVREKLLNKEVELETYHQDNFGRWICKISLEGQDISEWLLKEGLAVEY